MKKKEFTANRQNIKQANVIQVTLILENKLQKQIFYQNMTISWPTDMYILNTC